MSNEEPAKQIKSLAISFMAILFVSSVVLWGTMWNVEGEVADLNRKVERILESTQNTESKVQAMESQMSDLRISTRSALNANQYHRRNYSHNERRDTNYDGDR